MVSWLTRRLPWAMKSHYHGDPTLGKYQACSRCGHLILTGFVANHRVELRIQGTISTIMNRTYGKECAPEFSYLAIAIDGTVRAYTSDKVEITLEKMPERDLDEFRKLEKVMLAERSRFKS